MNSDDIQGAGTKQGFLAACESAISGIEKARKSMQGDFTLVPESDPFMDPHEPDPTALTGQAGPWITAGFDSECSISYCDGIMEGETIRADGQGGWECKVCVFMDSPPGSLEEEYYA